MSSEPRLLPSLRPASRVWLRRAAVLALWFAGLAASTAVAPAIEVSGLLFVLLGASAACLDTFLVEELRVASAGSSLFWEIAARNAWLAGATGSILFFVRAVGDATLEGEAMARAMALSLVPATYGLVLGALLFARAVRVHVTESGRVEGGGGHPWLGRGLFAALLAWTMVHPYLGASTPRFTPWDWVFYWPSIFVVLGGALTILWIAGGALRRRIPVVSLALAGTIGSLAGLVVSLVGFAERSISRVTAGLGFMVTACFVALVGMVFVADPVEDRHARHGERGVPSTWSRAAWLLFPAVTVLVLVAALVMVMTPMTMRL